MPGKHMSTTPTTITSTASTKPLQRLSNSVGAGAFMLIQHFPLLLKIQRSENSWSMFRLLLGCFGAALVILPLSFWVGWITGILAPLVGMTFFIASILLPPPEAESDTDRKARELGANTIVSGGEYQPGNGLAAQVRLFISSSHVWALDKNFDPLLVIPALEISALSVYADEDRWMLQIRWADRKAEFRYDGIFAERFARLAEESIRASLTEDSTAPLKRRAAAI